MKNLLRLSIIAVTSLTGTYAAPFMAIGDGAALFITGNLGVRADDNIFLAKDAESDLIFDIEPGVELTFGSTAQLRGTLSLSEVWVNYSDTSTLNHHLFTGDF